jgi:hypothetical protein
MFIHDGTEFYSDAYVPLYTAASWLRRLLWRLVGRHFGQERPHGKEYIFYVMDNPFAAGGKSALVNPVLYEKMRASLEASN